MIKKCPQFYIPPRYRETANQGHFNYIILTPPKFNLVIINN